jgi:hypothetical protein
VTHKTVGSAGTQGSRRPGRERSVLALHRSWNVGLRQTLAMNSKDERHVREVQPGREACQADESMLSETQMSGLETVLRPNTLSGWSRYSSCGATWDTAPSQRYAADSVPGGRGGLCGAGHTSEAWVTLTPSVEQYLDRIV